MERALVFVIVYLGLFLFGIGYNALVSHLEKHELDRGYTAFLVALGVLVAHAAQALSDNLEALMEIDRICRNHQEQTKED